MVKVYITDMREFPEDSYGKALGLVSEKRKESTKSFLHREDRIRSLTSGLFIRLLENEYHGESTLGPYSKPCMKHGKIQFNISHSGNYVVCAVSEYPIGIDVQVLEESYSGLLAHVMTTDELKIFNKKPSCELFTRLWTAKESYVKNIGKGLYLEPKTIQVLTDKGFVPPEEELVFTEVETDDTCRSMVCHDRRDKEVIIEKKGYPELMSGC